ncbi:MAG TPA: hypothetical protein H9881_03425 [Candidatus Stackebrandtia excrementipullorum]|nr:hypothetical protein [Candidatus Stackebrandtia excrementipullorum]
MLDLRHLRLQHRLRMLQRLFVQLRFDVVQRRRVNTSLNDFREEEVMKPLITDLAELEAQTFEIDDVTELSQDEAVQWSSCSTSSCCGCSSSSCGSCTGCSCSCGSTSG